MGYENGKIYWIVPQNNTGIALSVYGMFLTSFGESISTTALPESKAQSIMITL